jgi:hypothetical protein
MKGPGGRLRFDIRRLWECPACHRRELTAGDVVNRLCTCSTKSDPPRQNWMKLVEQKPARPAPPTPSPPSVEEAAQPVDTMPQSLPATPPSVESPAQPVETMPQSPPATPSPLPTSDVSTPPGS